MFDVDPAQIESLTSLQLVELLRRLLHAEAQAAGVALGNINVPLQITIPDGGEDGRIVWKDGVEFTDYLPGRDNFFQCKASNFGKDGWKKECWTKSSRRKGSKRVLTPALTSIVAVTGHYIGFTTEALTGQKMDDYVQAIKDGIVEAEGDPSTLGSIKLYGSNEIASWAAGHPSTALWLSEIVHQRALGGFGTVSSWGQRADFIQQPYAVDEDSRYVIGPSRTRDLEGSDNTTNAKAAWAKIIDHVEVAGRSVRITGASGLGKSRFVHQSLLKTSSTLAAIVSNSAVFADYRVVSAALLPTAADFAMMKRDTLLIVDECPRDVAVELARIAAAAGSRLRVITIDTDERALDKSVLHVSVAPSEGALIDSIIRARNPDVSDSVVSRLRDVCDGYPRFAILAATTLDLAKVPFETLDDIVSRVLSGSTIVGEGEVRALECLAMFDRIAIEGDGSPLDLVATEFGRMSGDEMYEHLTRAQDHDLVGRYGDQFAAQPRPIAEHLAKRRLRLIRPSLLNRFIKNAPDELALALLRRWRFMDTSPLIQDAAKLVIVGHLSRKDVISTARGTAMLDALVHIIPDQVAELLSYVVLPLSIDELSAARAGRRSLVEATAKLVFRSKSFNISARLLMKLAVSETEEWANNATGLFKQLFQLQLSGTEVPPIERFSILDEGLESDHTATVALCIDALESVFLNHFSRFGGSDEIGSGEPLKDWSPVTWDEVDDFHRQGVSRLLAARRIHPEFAERCEAILVRATRHMLNTGLYREHAQALIAIAGEKGGWPEAVESVGDWLYFDRRGANKKKSKYIRDLYDQLFPVDLIDRAIVFTQFWTSDIRDPDAIHKESDNDFGYSERAALDIADKISLDDELTLSAVRRMTPLDLKTVSPFAERLARRASNREAIFDLALSFVDAKGTGVRMLRGILRGIDLEDHALADACLQRAVETLRGTLPLIDLYSALSIDGSRIEQIIAELKAGRIKPAECTFLSYGRGLDDLPPRWVFRLLEQLLEHGSDGAWTALEVATMYRHGIPMSAEFAGMVKQLLVNPALIDAGRDRNRDSHLFETLTKQVRAIVGIDEDFGAGMSQQVLRLARSESWEIVSSLKSATRDLIAMLSADRPQILWAYIARFYNEATPIELNRLYDLIGPNEDRFDKSDHTGAGPLFALPKDELLTWADQSPERAAFLVSFFPTLSVDASGSVWHSEFEELGTRYGRAKEFRNALADRIRPRSWSGSIVPLLEIYLDPLRQWTKHQIPALATWAKDQLHRLERRIEREKVNEGGV